MKRNIILAVLVIGGVALADKVVTVLSSTANVYMVQLTPLPDGGVNANICGSANSNTGQLASQSCYNKELVGTAQTTAIGFMTGTALNTWKNNEGL